MRISRLINVTPQTVTVCLALALTLLGIMPGKALSWTGEPGTFVEASNALGIDVMTTGERDTWGHGAAFIDVDGDGQLELYVIMHNNEPNRLYRYRGATFEEIAVAAGCADVLDGRGVVFADYDNDGDPDLFVANDRSSDKLYRNDGSGRFVDVSSFAGVDYVGRSHSAAWGDYDNDGFLDLFVCSYGTKGSPVPNRLYNNKGDGTFTEVAETAGVDQLDVPALAVVWIDSDNDDDLDLYIANDKLAGNTMYSNNGDGTFADVSIASGTNLAMNAMGIAVADYDGNGFLDMYVSNTEEGNALLKNNGDGTFTDVAALLGVTNGRIAWGTAFFDYDNDGDDDLYVVNWAFFGGRNAKNVFFENTAGTFTAVTDDLGVGDEGPGYGLTVGDYNNDGYLDMFVNNQADDGLSRSVFYESVPLTNHWVKIKTVGTVSNRDGIGAKIRIAASGNQIKDVRSGSSYLSQLSPEIEFGLGTATTISTIEITWPSGTVDVFNGVAADKFYEAQEGDSTLRVVETVEPVVPVPATLLRQNQPNPFVHPSSPSTTIQFNLAAAGHVALDVYDARGRHVVTLINGPLLDGPQTASWDGTDAAGNRVGSGVYFYRLKTAGETLGRKMILLK